MNNHDTEEIWAPIAGWMHYEVSNIGRVRSERSTHGKRRAGGWRMIARFMTHGGYQMVRLFDKGRQWGPCVHRLVADAFCEPKQPHHRLVRHLDGNPSNNYWTNLKWGTSKENHDDMVRHCTVATGEDTNSKLTEEQAREIFKSNDRNSVLARRYGVGIGTIILVRNARTWQHVNGDKPSETAGAHSGPTPTKLTAELAREIFLSTESNRDVSARFGVSESFVSHIRKGEKWGGATAGLEATERNKLHAELGRQLVSPLQTFTEDQIREVFMSPLSGVEIAKKLDIAEGHVSQIRSRRVCQLITRNLVAPARDKQNHKITAETACAIFADPRRNATIAREFKLSKTMVGQIKMRQSWAHATKDLPGVVAGC